MVVRRSKPVHKRTQITYHNESTGTLLQVTNGMAGKIIALCTRNKTDEGDNGLGAGIGDFASRGIRALSIIHEELVRNEGEGSGSELISLLAIFSPCDDIKRPSTMRSFSESKARWSLEISSLLLSIPS